MAEIVSRNPELSLVLPVFNGEKTIAVCLQGWIEALAGLDYEIIIIDDGSSDATPEILSARAAGGRGERFRVFRQPNSGHGPAVRKGYDSARGEWVFQADSDDEIEPRHFAELWKLRGEAELVLAEREGRVQGFFRRLVTALEKAMTGALSPKALADPNVPFRLVRRARLREFCAAVRPDEFAPNLLMSVWALLRGWRVKVIKLPHNPAHQSPRTLTGLRLIKGCFAAAGGILRVLFRRKKEVQ